jgi:hypothetical protein
MIGKNSDEFVGRIKIKIKIKSKSSKSGRGMGCLTHIVICANVFRKLLQDLTCLDERRQTFLRNAPGW